MKKSYLMIAVASLVFGACANESTVQELKETVNEQAISFNSITGNVTKAAIGDIDDLKTENGFVVYGYKTINNWESIAQTVFSGKNVYWDAAANNNAGDWVYQGLRFWDKNAKYKFYAVAPYNPDDAAAYSINTTLGANFGYITIAGATSKISTASDDYLIDRNGVLDELGSNHTGATNPDVSFDFHHVMAKVSFALKSTLASGTINVTGLKMTGWNNAAGTFVQASASTPDALNCAEWTLANPAVAGDIDLVGTGTGNTSVELTCSTSATATALTDWYIMVPQAIAANTLTFTVTYTYTDNNGTPADTSDDYVETFTNQAAAVATAQTWGTDSHTVYTLDIKPNAINFDVDQICGFCVDANVGVEVK